MHRYLALVGAVVIAALSVVHAGPLTDAMCSECGFSIPNGHDVDVLNDVERTLWCLKMLSNFEDVDDQIILRAKCGYGRKFGFSDTSKLDSADGFQKLFITELAGFLNSLFIDDALTDSLEVYRQNIKCALRSARSLAKDNGHGLPVKTPCSGAAVVPPDAASALAMQWYDRFIAEEAKTTADDGEVA